MATHLVNLDALILREDFHAQPDNTTQLSNRLGRELKIEELERTYRYLLRKPDFQRETSGWTPQRVADFIKSFVDGDLIPAVIMWRSSLSGAVFVIDGAHRLSALMAWALNDYGDGEVSRAFWDHSIPAAQRKLASATKELVEKEIGAYKRLQAINQDSRLAPNDAMLLRARNAVNFRIDLQWVEGNAKSAERSFFLINGSPSIIDPTELEIIKARKKPNAIATRALMNAGRGHRYWSDFPEDTRDQIERLAKHIYDGLFLPLLESPIKTLDLPIAGQGYSANTFKMILDFVNLVNEITPAMWQERETSKGNKSSAVEKLSDDEDGVKTVQFLKTVKKSADLISGNEKGSLGLHPAVYFYSQTGKFQPSSFLATVKFMLELRDKGRLIEFTDHRERFEEFMVRHRHLVSKVGHALGSRTRPLESLVTLYRTVFNEVVRGEQDHSQICRTLAEQPGLRSLKNLADDSEPRTQRGFKKEHKSAAFINRAIDQPVRCAICSARLHVNAIHTDHKVRKEDGGTGDVSNAQSTHPYCNSGYKEAKAAKERKRSAARSMT